MILQETLFVGTLQLLTIYKTGRETAPPIKGGKSSEEIHRETTLDIDVYDDMMNALAYKSRELYHQDEDMDDYDEYLDSYMQTEDEDERRLFRCREYNL